MEPVSIHLYGKLRRFAEKSEAGHVMKVEPQPGETVEQLLARVEIPLDEIYNIFFNAKLLATRSAMAHWIRYQQVHENPLEWKLDITVKAGDRIGLFGRDTGALVIWTYRRTLSGEDILAPGNKMAAVYDKFAKQYKASKRLPFREFIEWHSYNKLLGDISQKSVLDLACGEGFYTRRVKRKGAGKVVGVDISGEMIRLAKQQEQNHPLGVDYVLGDVMTLGSIGKFDLVVAAYLLNYAQTKEQLLKMFQTIAANLKSGGRFVGINNNPDQPPESFPICEKYGFTKSISGPLNDGTPITYEFFRSGQKFRFDNYYLNRATHEWAAMQAGLNSIQWHKIEVSPDGLKICGPEFWQDFIDYEPIVGIECHN